MLMRAATVVQVLQDFFYVLLHVLVIAPLLHRTLVASGRPSRASLVHALMCTPLYPGFCGPHSHTSVGVMLHIALVTVIRACRRVFTWPIRASVSL